LQVVQDQQLQAWNHLGFGADVREREASLVIDVDFFEGWRLNGVNHSRPVIFLKTAVLKGGITDAPNIGHATVRQLLTGHFLRKKQGSQPCFGGDIQAQRGFPDAGSGRLVIETTGAQPPIELNVQERKVGRPTRNGSSSLQVLVMSSALQCNLSQSAGMG